MVVSANSAFFPDERLESNRTRVYHQQANPVFYWDYTFDHRNRLTSATKRTGNPNDSTPDPIALGVSYDYDVFDRRVSRTVDTNGNGTSDLIERFFYDGDHVLFDYVDPDGAAGGAGFSVQKRYLYGPAVDQLLAQEDTTVAIGSANRVLWHLGDHQDTTRDLVDQNGAIVTHYIYDAFGEVLAGDTTKTRYLYTGRELDSVTGLQYNRHRWYDPFTGRWISEDPIGFEGGDYNLSRYVGNMATYTRDPSGLAGLDSLGPQLGAMTNSAEAKDEATRIGEAIRHTYENNSRLRFPRWRDDRVKGYYCHDWAYAFEDAFNLENPQYFSATVEEASNGDRVHYWLKITPRDDPSSATYVDDGWGRPPNFVHPSPPMPTDPGWTKGNPGDVPREECTIPPAYDSNGNRRQKPGKPFMLPPTIFGPYPPGWPDDSGSI